MENTRRAVILRLLGALGFGAATVSGNAAAERVVLEEVMVTAERRVSSVQDTAAAITAMSGEDLRNLGVAQPEDMIKVTPGLHATTIGASLMQFYIRGVGNFAANTFAEGAVSFNLDGVYISRPSTYAGLFYDLERVEVLKGPQGTLYGRNSTGGAINLITARPSLDGELSGYLKAEAGNESYGRVDGAVNIPVSDELALRGALQVLDRDAFYADGSGDAGSYSGRLSALFEPNDAISLLLIGDYQNADNNGGGGTISGPHRLFDGDFLSSDPWGTGATSPEANALLSGNFARAPLGDPEASNKLKASGITAVLNWDLEAGALTVIPSYRTADYEYINYAWGFLGHVDEEADQTSLEVRLASNEPAFIDWVVGAYYFDESIKTNSYYLQQLTFPGAEEGENSTRLKPELDTESWAAFGQLTFNLDTSLRLIAGLRYMEEDKAMAGESIGNPPFSGPSYVQYPLIGERSWDEVTWKLGVEYDLAANNLLYANVGTGFKAGGFFSEQQQYGNSFEPEKITAYALGSKNRFLDNRLQVNAELFFWDYEDHQESHLSLSQGGYSLFVTENVGAAEMKGVDLDIEFLLTANDRFTLQLQYLDAEFTEFNYRGFSPSGPPNVGCQVANVGGPFYNVNCDGFDAIRAPQWAGSLGYQHIFNLSNGGSLVLDLRTQYSDETYNAIDYLPTQLQESYTMSDASLTWFSADQRWSLGLWGRNLEDEAVKVNGFSSPFTDLTYTSLRAPRTYGISVGLEL